MKKPQTPEEKRAARKADRSRGTWYYPPLVIDLGGVKFSVSSDGSVYERRMVRAGAGARRRGKDTAKPEADLVPGPLVKVTDFGRAEAVRQAIRAARAADERQTDTVARAASVLHFYERTGGVK